MRYRNARDSAGFTLIEAMIVVAIIAILTAVALPSYTSYIQRGRLTEATAKLSDIRTRLEVFFQDNRKYGASGTGCGVPVAANNSGYFNFTCYLNSDPASTTQVDDQSYVVHAIGAGAMAGFEYTIDQAGAKQTRTFIGALRSSDRLLDDPRGVIMLNAHRQPRQAGMTLIEMMTGVAIASILAAVATPSFTGFLRNTEVRGSSEALLQGLQLARTEAIRRNRQICFDWSSVGTGWTVSTGCLSAPGTVPVTQIIQSQPNREGSAVGVVTTTPTTSVRVVFNGFGRVVPNIVGGSTITRIDITSQGTTLTRRILVSAGDSSGRIFVCDPTAAAGTQMACS